MEFENKLTKEEISRGLMTYIVRGSSGHTRGYPYREIKAVSSGDVFVLFFPGRSFAIVAKGRMNNELRILFEERINF